jgi:hypothetical protein
MDIDLFRFGGRLDGEDIGGGLNVCLPVLDPSVY